MKYHWFVNSKFYFTEFISGYYVTYFGYDFSDCCPHLYCGSWNTMFRPLYPTAFLRCPLFIWAQKKGVHSSRTPCLINSQTLIIISQIESFLCPDKKNCTPEDVRRIQRPKAVFQLTTIKMRTVQKIIIEIIHIKPHLKKQMVWFLCLMTYQPLQII